MKLAILGSGQIVMDFLTMAKDLPDTELVSMFGIEAERAKMEGLANTYGIGKVYTDYQEVLNDPEVRHHFSMWDCPIICTIHLQSKHWRTENM